MVGIKSKTIYFRRHFQQLKKNTFNWKVRSTMGCKSKHSPPACRHVHLNFLFDLWLNEMKGGKVIPLNYFVQVIAVDVNAIKANVSLCFTIFFSFKTIINSFVSALRLSRWDILRPTNHKRWPTWKQLKVLVTRDFHQFFFFYYFPYCLFFIFRPQQSHNESKAVKLLSHLYLFVYSYRAHNEAINGWIIYGLKRISRNVL